MFLWWLSGGKNKEELFVRGLSLSRFHARIDIFSSLQFWLKSGCSSGDVPHSFHGLVWLGNAWARSRAACRARCMCCTYWANYQTGTFQLSPACSLQWSGDNYFYPFQLEASSWLDISSCSLRAVLKIERSELWKIIRALICAAETSFQSCCEPATITATTDYCHCTNALLK